MRHLIESNKSEFQAAMLTAFVVWLILTAFSAAGLC